MGKALSLTLTLCVVWVFWSGYFDSFFLMGMGLLSAVLVVALSVRMGVADPEGHPVHIFAGLVLYWFWLAKAVIKANLAMTRIILAPRLSIEPQVLQVESSQKSALGRTIYANSITLTPGTVSIDVYGKSITVHAIDTESADELRRGAMDWRVTSIEGEE